MADGARIVRTPREEAGATGPDPIEDAARAELDLIEGESIARCWRAGTGYLVMTDLRCVRLWRRRELLRPSEWHAGPSFFFYDLAPPVVVHGRFVQLANRSEVDAGATRFLVADPPAVCAEIEASRAGGRAEWERRRAAVAERLAELRRRGPGGDGAPAWTPCSYCGNRIPAGADRCPSCGAPRT